MTGGSDDHQLVAESLRVLLSQREATLDGDVTVLTGGFDTYVYRFSARATGRLKGDLVLRVHPSVERRELAQREFTLQSWAAEHGYPAAEPLLRGDDLPGVGLPYMVMRRAPGRSMLAVMSARPWQARRLLRQLGQMHARLHELDATSAPVPPRNGPLVDRRLRDLQCRATALGTEYLARLDWLMQHQTSVADEEPRLGHNDFHPLNVLVDDTGDFTVIDWANADVGDYHHDVARTLVTFEVASLAASSPVERAALRLSKGLLAGAYRRAYERHRRLDPPRLRYWMAFHALEGAAQVDQLHSGAFGDNTRSDSSSRVPPGLARHLLRLFDGLAGSG